VVGARLGGALRLAEQRIFGCHGSRATILGPDYILGHFRHANGTGAQVKKIVRHRDSVQQGHHPQSFPQND